MICQCFGPLKISQQELKTRPIITLSHDELQTLVDRDINGLIMDEACRCMGISKTVYAGIYTSARTKVTKALVSGSILQVECANTDHS
jgi:predicted DNA-binding protein (UPF0251 family)